MSQIQNIDKLIAGLPPEDALAKLDRLMADNEADAALLFARGKLHWRLGHRAKATSDYAAAAEIDPDSPAVRALELARDVEAFFNPDLYNP
ncbi:MAG: hypothetical protein HDS56_05235 [Barnesiella sp.]|nr:hypothetical protein [Bacteroidales bacterium]MBD5250560.1 hypothetical protein [Barnesiella sp.]MBD5253767.1 hypothetical protein [Barnesiella sp.]MBD5345388.1 hypothetical protein [Bacteroides sp.]